ncbi:MAG: hypothetical protein RBT66_04870 [bacterium]|nr:hypothetical protein [bacterium]
MSKKILGSEINGLFKGSPKESKPQTRPAERSLPQDRPAVEKGLQPGYTRATIIIHKETLEKIKAIAYWEPGKNIKKVVNTAIEEYLSRYEKANGNIRPIPKEEE